MSKWQRSLGDCYFLHFRQILFTTLFTVLLIVHFVSLFIISTQRVLELNNWEAIMICQCLCKEIFIGNLHLCLYNVFVFTYEIKILVYFLSNVVILVNDNKYLYVMVRFILLPSYFLYRSFSVRIFIKIALETVQIHIYAFIY